MSKQYSSILLANSFINFSCNFLISTTNLATTRAHHSKSPTYLPRAWECHLARGYLLCTFGPASAQCSASGGCSCRRPARGRIGYAAMQPSIVCQTSRQSTK